MCLISALPSLLRDRSGRRSQPGGDWLASSHVIPTWSQALPQVQRHRPRRNRREGQYDDPAADQNAYGAGKPDIGK
jgi:hypothetical protein